MVRVNGPRSRLFPFTSPLQFATISIKWVSLSDITFGLFHRNLLTTPHYPLVHSGCVFPLSSIWPIVIPNFITPNKYFINNLFLFFLDSNTLFKFEAHFEENGDASKINDKPSHQNKNNKQKMVHFDIQDRRPSFSSTCRSLNSREDAPTMATF